MSLTCEGLWFSPCTPVSSTNETDRHDIAEILLKVAFNTITLNPLYCGGQMINWWGNRRWNTWKKTTELLKVSDNFDTIMLYRVHLSTAGNWTPIFNVGWLIASVCKSNNDNITLRPPLILWYVENYTIDERENQYLNTMSWYEFGAESWRYRNRTYFL